MQHSSLGFGVTGSLDIETVVEIAKRLEASGYDSLWINDTPGGDSLGRLAAAAEVTHSLTLATGVIPVDRTPASEIAERIRVLGLPQDRLIIGIGSSAKPSPLTRVKDALAELHEAFDFPVVVGSLGPRMRELGAMEGDGLLFNWLPPTIARETTQTLREQAGSNRTIAPIAATYVRTGLGQDALTALKTEVERYTAIPSYAANFERLGITAMESVVWGESAQAIQAGLLAYDGTVDHVILRAITATNDLDQYLALVEAGASIA